MSEDFSPQACSLHPGATLHKNGKTKGGSQRYRCGACKVARDKTNADRQARARANGKSSTRRTPEGRAAELARMKAAYRRAKEAKNSLKIEPQPP